MLAYIEQSQFAEWFLTSMWGFPTFIALHSVGMAFVVGLSAVIAFRYLLPDPLAPVAIKTLFRFAWLGFFLNLVTGLALLASRISEYLVDLTFLLKLLFVFIGMVCLKILQRRTISAELVEGASAPDTKGFGKVIEGSDFGIGILMTFSWLAAVTAGRWIAYLSSLYGAG